MIRICKDLTIETVYCGSVCNIYVHGVDELGVDQIKGLYLAAERELRDRGVDKPQLLVDVPYEYPYNYEP